MISFCNSDTLRKIVEHLSFCVEETSKNADPITYQKFKNKRKGRTTSLFGLYN